MCTRLRKELDEDSKGKWTAEGQGISGGPRQFDVHMSQVCADDRALAVIVAAHIEGEPAEGPPADVAVRALNVLARCEVKHLTGCLRMRIEYGCREFITDKAQQCPRWVGSH